ILFYGRAFIDEVDDLGSAIHPALDFQTLEGIKVAGLGDGQVEAAFLNAVPLGRVLAGGAARLFAGGGAAAEGEISHEADDSHRQHAEKPGRPRKPSPSVW